MIEAKVPEGLPQVDARITSTRYLKSGGKDGHMYTLNRPGMDKAITVPALLLVTKGRKSRREVSVPAVLRRDRQRATSSIASKGGAPDHPGWYKNMLAHPDVEVQVGTKTVKAKARTATGAERAKLWEEAVELLAALRRLPEEGRRPRDPRRGPRSGELEIAPLPIQMGRRPRLTRAEGS